MQQSQLADLATGQGDLLHDVHRIMATQVSCACHTSFAHATRPYYCAEGSWTTITENSCPLSKVGVTMTSCFFDLIRMTCNSSSPSSPGAMFKALTAARALSVSCDACAAYCSVSVASIEDLHLVTVNWFKERTFHVSVFSATQQINALLDKRA